METTEERRARYGAVNATRNARILAAALELAREDDYQFITRAAVAERAGVAEGTVNTAYGTMRDLKQAVLREAVSLEILPVIAKGLAYGSAITEGIDPELKRRAAASLV